MRAAAFPFLFSLSVGAFHGFLARIRTGFRREDIQQPFRKSGFPSCPFLFQGGIPMGDRHGKRRAVQPVQDGGGELPAKGRALEYRSRSVVDVGHPVNHALFVFPEYGDDAFFGQEPEESLPGVLTQGFPDIIRKSKFPQNPKRSVRFSGKRTKRSVQKRKARNTQKAETKVL